MKLSKNIWKSSNKFLQHKVCNVPELVLLKCTVHVGTVAMSVASVESDLRSVDLEAFSGFSCRGAAQDPGTDVPVLPVNSIFFLKKKRLQ